MLPEWCMRYIGLPFLAHGRDQKGLDCWGLVRLVYFNEFGIDLPALSGAYEDTERQSHGVIASLYQDEARQRWMKVEADKAGTGNVVVLRFAGQPVHVGIYLGWNNMLHVMRGTESCIERIDTPRWNKIIEGFYHYGRSD
jgi:cell wall-associated NlpC family hydrolase